MSSVLTRIWNSSPRRCRMAFASSQNLQSSFVSSRTSISFKSPVLDSDRYGLFNRIGQLACNFAMLLLDPLQPLFKELQLVAAA